MPKSVRQRPNRFYPSRRDLQSPCSGCSRTLAGRFALALAIGALALSAATGCDRDRAVADRDVQRALDQASAQLGAGQADDAVKTIHAVAGNTAASLAMQIQAKAQLATAQLTAGRDAGLRLSSANANALRLVHEVELLSIRIRIGNTMASGYAKLDPKEIQADNQARIAAATGDAAHLTFPADDKGDIALPTLAACKQQVSQLQADIARRKADIDQLDKQRQAAIAQADQLEKTADGAKGQASLTAYKNASDQRKVASDLGSKLEIAKAQVAPVEQQLAVAEAEQQEIERYLAALDEQAKQRQSGWKTLEKQVAAQQAVNKAIVDGKGAIDNAASVDAKISDLKKALTDARDLAGQAESLLSESVKNYEQASTDAQTLRTQLRGGAPKSGFDQTVAKTFSDAYDPAYYKIQTGIAQTELANLYASQAATLSARAAMLNNLEQAAKAAGVDLPAEASDTQAASAAKDARAKADAAYKDATDTLASAADSVQGNDARESHAKMAQIFALYGWAKLQAAIGDANDAKKNYADAVAIRDQLIQNESPNLVLPAELTPAPKLPAAATSAPAAAPATPAAPPAPAAPAAPATPAR